MGSLRDQREDKDGILMQRVSGVHIVVKKVPMHSSLGFTQFG